jgi:hypothetical protein
MIHCISEELGVGLPGLRRHRNEAALHEKKSFCEYAAGGKLGSGRRCRFCYTNSSQLSTWLGRQVHQCKTIIASISTIQTISLSQLTIQTISLSQSVVPLSYLETLHVRTAQLHTSLSHERTPHPQSHRCIRASSVRLPIASALEKKRKTLHTCHQGRLSMLDHPLRKHCPDVSMWGIPR